MKYLFRYSLILAVAGFILGCAPQGDSPEQMIAAAKALDQQFVEAYSKGDVDGVMATYWNSPELVSYSPDAMEARGWQAVRDGLATFFTSTSGAKLELLETNYKVAGNVVFGWGKWRLTIPAGGDKPMEMLGRYSDVKAKRDGKWVYIFDHASVPLPPSPEK